MKDIRKTPEYVDEMEVAMARAKAEIAALREALAWIFKASDVDDFSRSPGVQALHEHARAALKTQPPEPAQDDEVKP